DLSDPTYVHTDISWSTNPDDWEAARAQLAAIIDPVVAPPRNLAAAPGNRQITLAWTASAGATGYNVKRATVSGGPYATVAGNVGATSYPDKGLTNGTTYYSVVSALSTAGESATSSQASANPLAPPAAPVNVTAVPGNAQVTVSWAANATATSY